MSLYETAIEPECPRPDYDPAMDEPEPRRKSCIDTWRARGMPSHGMVTHVLHGHTRLYTGWHWVDDTMHKYASIGIKYATSEPLVQCDRISAARMLKTIRRGQPC